MLASFGTDSDPAFHFSRIRIQVLPLKVIQENYMDPET